MTGQLTNNQVLLKECIKQEYEDNGGYDSINNYFEFFAASQIYKTYNFSDDEILSGIVGGGDDGGCDSIHILLNGNLVTQDQFENISAPRGSVLELLITQAKYVTSFKEDAIIKWRAISENMLDLNKNIAEYKRLYNELVLESFQLFRDLVTKTIRNQVQIKITYSYITIANEVHPKVVQQANDLKIVVNKLFPTATVNVEFVDANQLFSLYGRNGDVVEELNLIENAIARTDKDYIGLVNLATFFEFITDENHRLIQSYFDSNVRDYQGHNIVNTAIAETLSNRNMLGDFWWLNNGVTILASKIQLTTPKKIVVENPEIVNGQQTSREIYNYFSSNIANKNNETRNILVRLIRPDGEEVRDQIISATNNQTNIPKYSLRVTDPIHYQIELYFKSRGLFYDRRKNFYKNQKKKSSDIIGVSFLAQILISIILKKPDFARARPSTLLDEDNTYNKLYNKDNNLGAYYKAAKIGQFVRCIIKQDANLSQVAKSDIQFAVIYLLVRKITNKENITFNDLSNIDLDQITDELLNTCKQQVYDKYIELGGNSVVAKSSQLTEAIDNIINNVPNAPSENI